MYGKRQESGLIDIIPSICTSAMWGQYPVLSPPESPRVSPLGVDAAVDCWIVGILFLSWVPSGLTIRAAGMWWLEVCNILCLLMLLLFSRSVVSDSLRPREQQHVKLPCPSPSPGLCLNSCPMSQWCHPTISSSVIPFSFCLQSFPASGSFPMSQFFESGGQGIGASASASVLQWQAIFFIHKKKPLGGGHPVTLYLWEFKDTWLPEVTACFLQRY